MNLPTIIVLVVVLAMVIVAIRAMRTGKGKCSCEIKKPANSSKCASCSADCPLKKR